MIQNEDNTIPQQNTTETARVNIDPLSQSNCESNPVLHQSIQPPSPYCQSFPMQQFPNNAIVDVNSLPFDQQESIHKAEDAYTLALIGCVISLTSPIAGWILGGIAKVRVNKGLRYVSGPNLYKNKKVANLSIILSTIMFVINFLYNYLQSGV